MTLTCIGCGARIACRPSADDPRIVDMFHPHPLCAHVLERIAAGVAKGPITSAHLDRETGEIVEDPHGGNN